MPRPAPAGLPRAESALGGAGVPRTLRAAGASGGPARDPASGPRATLEAARRDGSDGGGPRAVHRGCQGGTGTASPARRLRGTAERAITHSRGIPGEWRNRKTRGS